MDDMTIEVSFDGRKAQRLMGLLANAYDDYVAARVLFNNDMLRQACILTNQSLEKIMKAYIESQNESEHKGHDTVKLYHRIVYYKYEIAEHINVNFLKVINGIYKTRYFEQLNAEYHHTIVQYKFLAEIDYIMSKFLPIIGIKVNTGGRSHYQKDIEEGNPNLLLNNYVLNGISKTQFLLQKQIVECFLLHVNRSIVVKLRVNGSADNKNFLYPSLKFTSPTTMQLFDWGLEEFSISTNKKDI